MIENTSGLLKLALDPSPSAHKGAGHRLVENWNFKSSSSNLDVDERHPGLDGEDAGDEDIIKPEEVRGLGGQTGGH